MDIFIIAFLIYQLIRLLLRTRASSVFKGIGVFLVFFWLSEVLELNVVNWALEQFINTGVIVLVVLFQPELRRALEQLGRSSIISASSANKEAKSKANSRA